MPRGTFSAPRFGFPQPRIDFFERSEKAYKRGAQPLRHSPPLQEIASPELVGDRDGGGAHGPVLMGSTRPYDALFPVYPDRETHVIL